MTEVDIRVEVGDGGTGVIRWDETFPPDALLQAVSTVADDALLGAGLRRLEVHLPGPDRAARRAVTRAGFRLEGVRRQGLALPDGSHLDVHLYARLASDQVHGPNGFSGVMNSVLPRKRLIAHVRMTDDDGRVLLCETRFKTDWELPGGIVEPGEAPRLGATREVAEELGLDRPVGRLLVVDWMPPYLGWDDALELIFDGGRITEAELPGLTLQPSEIVRIRLCTLAEAAELLTPLAHRRLAVAAGLAPGATAYLEDGAAPSADA